MKVLHAPLDIGWQASTIVKMQKALGAESYLLVFNRHPLGHGHDICLDLNGKTTIVKGIIQVTNFIKCLVKYDVFHFHFGTSLLPFNVDLPVLRLFGKKIIMHYWGSEIRQSDIAIDYVYFKTLDELQKIYPREDDDKKRGRIKKIEKYVNLTIVGDYPLSPYSPKSTVIKQAIDLTKLNYVGCGAKRDTIQIVHAPSDREKKGTKYIFPVIDRLKMEGYDIDFIVLENKKHAEALQIYTVCDIIIDQLVLESHGILPLECMALGKPVLCRIDEKFMKYYPGLPILRTDPDNLYYNLKLLIENPDLRKELGERGRKYVEDVHDSKKIAKQLLEIYKSI